MGKPLKKKYFGTGAGNQIKIRAKIGTNAEGDGFIVKQIATSRYLVNVAGNTGICRAVYKASGTLVAGDMIIQVKDAALNLRTARKVKAHTLVLDDGTVAKWSFAEPVVGSVRVADVEGYLVDPVITISAQPANSSVVTGNPATVSLTATVTQGATITAQWQVKAPGDQTFTNVVGGTPSVVGNVFSYNTGNLLVGQTGIQYRAVLSTANNVSVTSGTATITVTAS